jgi:hypothetical protein
MHLTIFGRASTTMTAQKLKTLTIRHCDFNKSQGCRRQSRVFLRD